MASKISTIYDAIVAELGTIFSTKTRIPNPYNIENNPVNFIRDGWGLTIGGANKELQAIRNITKPRTFNVILTREVYRLDTNQTAIDTTSKALLEDEKTLIDNMESSDKFGLGGTVIKVDYESTDDISLIGASKSHFLTINVSFRVLYRDLRP